MLITPVARQIEAALPDAASRRFGGRLLALVVASGDRQPFSDQDLSNVTIIQQTAGKQATILIPVLRLAVDWT
jgi:hypothetical protein